jgi:hypothetical protein
MRTRITLPLIFTAACIIVFSCRENTSPLEKQKPKSEHAHLAEPKAWAANVTYRLDSIPDKAAADSFFRRLKPEDLDVVLALNRIDRKEVKKGTVLVIPSMIFPDFADYSTFPLELKEADTLKKLVLVSLRNQSFGIYEYGSLVKCGPVSSGKQAAPTPPGKYHTNWKKDVKVSTIDPDWIMPWYFNIENKKGIAFHKYELPGYPASHACIRLREQDAIWIYNWAEKWQLGDQGRKVLKNGTPVVIFGSYDFGADPVWRSLPQNPKIMAITDAEMSEIRQLLKDPGVNKVEAPEVGAP